jgi:D-aspartate ligase
MKNKAPVIIFGDHLSAFGAIRGLSKHKIPIYMVSSDGKGMCTKSRFVKKILKLKPKDGEFIEKLNNWFDQEVGEDCVLIVAGSDQYLEVLAQNRDELRKEMKITFPDWEAVKKVREKRLTYKIAEELGIPIPKTFYITSYAELENLVREQKETLTYPMFMKAEHSSALLSQYGTKGVICHDEKELLDSYKRYDGFGGELLLQDLIPGEFETIKTVLMSLNRKSEPTGLLINHKVRSQGKFLSGTLVQTDWSDTLLDYSLKLTRKIGYYGYAGTQFKLDPRDGVFKLMEINGRMSMSNSLAFRSGVNLPYLMYQEALSGSLPAIKEFKQNYPNKILWWYFLGDMMAIINNKEYLRPFSYLKSLIGRGYTIEPLSWRDPYPFLYTLMVPFVNLFRKLNRKLRFSKVK